jgi:hypothetical protein
MLWLFLIFFRFIKVVTVNHHDIIQQIKFTFTVFHLFCAYYNFEIIYIVTILTIAQWLASIILWISVKQTSMVLKFISDVPSNLSSNLALKNRL